MVLIYVPDPDKPQRRYEEMTDVEKLQYLLESAISSWDIDLVRELIKEGADPRLIPDALELVIGENASELRDEIGYKNHVALTQLLLKHGVNTGPVFHQTDETNFDWCWDFDPLCSAYYYEQNFSEIIELLLNAGVDMSRLVKNFSEMSCDAFPRDEDDVKDYLRKVQLLLHAGLPRDIPAVQDLIDRYPWLGQ